LLQEAIQVSIAAYFRVRKYLEVPVKNGILVILGKAKEISNNLELNLEDDNNTVNSYKSEVSTFYFVGSIPARFFASFPNIRSEFTKGGGFRCSSGKPQSKTWYYQKNSNIRKAKCRCKELDKKAQQSHN
jgi:hypothetical protein